MYAIIECGGKQYRVAEGDVIRVEKLTAEVGTTLDIDKVLLVGGDNTVIGTPLVAGAKVSCRVLNHDKAKKILVFRYKPKKNIRKKYGHRQPFTMLLIEKIVMGGSAQSETAAAAEKPKRTRKAAATAEVAEA